MQENPDRPDLFSVLINVPVGAVIFFVFVVDGMSCLSYDYPVICDEEGNRYHVFQAKHPEVHSHGDVISHLHLRNLQDEEDEEAVRTSNLSTSHCWQESGQSTIERDVSVTIRTEQSHHF